MHTWSTSKTRSDAACALCTTTRTKLGWAARTGRFALKPHSRIKLKCKDRCPLCHHHFSSTTSSSHLFTIQNSGKPHSLHILHTNASFPSLKLPPLSSQSKQWLLGRQTLCYVMLVCLGHQLWYSEQPSWSLPISAYFPTCSVLFPSQPLLNILASGRDSCAMWGQKGDYFLYISTLKDLPRETNKWTRLMNCTLLTDQAAIFRHQLSAVLLLC